MPNPEVLVQRQLDAYNARDLEASLECFSEEVCLRELHDNSPIAEGKPAMRALYKNLFENSPNLHAALLNRIVQDQVVVDHEEVRGLRAETERAVAIYRVEEGQIHHVWFA